ncbi:MAG: orotate phosphoribosyltransferase [Parasphingopyxis sp.]|nr:orotate phosphoribosyltransferase [Sphingomonadales bacterium]
MATVLRPSPSIEAEGTECCAPRWTDMEVDPPLSELFALVKERSFRTGDFTLASGKKSNLYFNMKPTMMNARGAELTARAFLDIMRELDIEIVSGLEMGAVPIIGSMAALSSVDERPIIATFVRKSAKKHGTKDLIEGLGPDQSLRGRNVLVVDDVATSGGSILTAIKAVREAGGIVDYAACVVDRDEGASKLLAGHGVELRGVLHARAFIDGN